MWQQGGSKQQTGNRDGAGEARWKLLGNGDGADEAWRQSIGDRDGANTEMLPPQEAEEAAHRGGGGDSGGERWGPKESPCGADGPTTMVADEARRDKEETPETPRGGSSTTVGVPTDSTHLARIKPTPQGLDHLTDREFTREGSDDTTKGAGGGGETNTPANGYGNGCGTDGVGEDKSVHLPKTRGDGNETPGGTKQPRRNKRGGRTGMRGPGGVTPPLLGVLGLVP